MLETIYTFFKPHLLPLLYALVIVAVLPLLAGYVVLLERKVMADMQARLGPMRVGPHGLLQPIADAVKLLMKEDIIPESADKWIFWLAPLLSVTAGMLAMAALPFGPVFQIADLNVGLMFILGISSMGIYGIVLGGWASNSHYSLLGALRSAAQLVSYETAAGMAVVSAVILGGTLSTSGLVNVQAEQHVWFIFVAPIGFFLYLVASIATTLFLGGWLRPFASTKAFNFLDYVPMLLMLLVGGYSLYRAPKQPVKIQKIVMVGVAGLCFGLAAILALPVFTPSGTIYAAMKPGVHGAFWFLFKVGIYLYIFLWLRFTFPRYRFDQLMKLGWHFLIPVSIVNVFGVALASYLHRGPDSGGMGWNLWAAILLTTVITFLIAAWLAKKSDHPPAEPVTAEKF